MITIFFCEIYDDGTVGGSHSILYNIVSNLDRTRFKPYVGFYGDNLYIEKYEQLGIPVVRLPEFKPACYPIMPIRKAVNWWRLIFRKRQYFRTLFRKLGVDLVVLNNTLYTAEPYIQACCDADIPIVIHERGINTYSRSEINLSRFVAASIPMSAAIHKTLIDQGVRSKSIYMLYDGIDPEKIKAQKPKDQVKKELGIPSADRVIGMIGNVKPWKGQAYFVEAMTAVCKKYDDVAAVMAGSWKSKDHDFKTRLDRMISDAGLEDRIRFLGYRTDIPDLLASLDIFVHASTKPEPFGMVVIEAMAARVPVIATNFGGPLESLANGDCGILVRPENHTDIASACSAYLDSEIFRQETIEKAYDRYRKLFLLEKTIQSLSDIYERCVGR